MHFTKLLLSKIYFNEEHSETDSNDEDVVEEFEYDDEATIDESVHGDNIIDNSKDLSSIPNNSNNNNVNNFVSKSLPPLPAPVNENKDNHNYQPFQQQIQFTQSQQYQQQIAPQSFDQKMPQQAMMPNANVPHMAQSPYQMIPQSAAMPSPQEPMIPTGGETLNNSFQKQPLTPSQSNQLHHQQQQSLKSGPTPEKHQQQQEVNQPFNPPQPDFLNQQQRNDFGPPPTLQEVQAMQAEALSNQSKQQPQQQVNQSFMPPKPDFMNQQQQNDNFGPPPTLQEVQAMQAEAFSNRSKQQQQSAFMPPQPGFMNQQQLQQQQQHPNGPPPPTLQEVQAMQAEAFANKGQQQQQLHPQFNQMSIGQQSFYPGSQISGPQASPSNPGPSDPNNLMGPPPSLEEISKMPGGTFFEIFIAFLITQSRVLQNRYFCDESGWLINTSLTMLRKMCSFHFGKTIF